MPLLYCNRQRRPGGVGATLISVLFLVLATFHARSATQSWNADGVGGGNGTWDTGITPDWDSGDTWTNGNNALFTGTGGTITVVNPSAYSLTFSASGPYLLQGGMLTLTGSEITVNSNATIASSITSYYGLYQTGTGILAVTGSANFAGPFGLGNIDDEFGTLAVQGGGTLSGSNANVGYNAGSDGTVTVSGTGSTWTVRNALDVGQSGTGTLAITDGGSVSSSYVYIGNSGAGTLSITNGGALTSTGAVIGYYAGADGTATVSGAGSVWTDNSYLYVGGVSGTGAMMITDGGAVTTPSVSIGDGPASSGTASVSGPGSTWTITSLTVGEYGAGTLTIDGGATVLDENAQIASGSIGTVTAAGSGTVTVSGTGSMWTTLGNLVVGNYGMGTLAISDGASVSSQFASLGDFYNPYFFSAGTGMVTVSGPGSTWTIISGTLYISDASNGVLQISDGGAASCVSCVIGAGLNGSATVSGTGSTWTVADDLYIGANGIGATAPSSLQIIDGAVVTTGSFAYVGDGRGPGGTATVSGSGSEWTSTFLSVGENTAGTLQITGGGAVSTSSNGYIGDAAGSSGMVTVSGAGSTWTGGLLSSFSVGQSGGGSLLINASGAVSDAFGSIGTNAGSVGTATVSGSGSMWTNSTSFEVGVSGTGTLQIAGGATVSTDNDFDGSTIGANANSNGSVTVSGPGSTWTNSGYLDVGNYGTATLLITNGGTVSDGFGGASIASNPGSSGAVTVTGSGSAWTNSAALYIAGSASGQGGSGYLFITSGGAVSTPQATVYTSGTLVLGENPILNGPVTVSGGAVSLVDGQLHTVTLTSPITVAAGSSLDFEVGNGSDQIAFSGSGSLMVTGTSFVNIYDLSGQFAPGTDVLISASTGNLALGNVYNSGNYTYAILTTSSTQDLVITATTPLTTAYWKGTQNNLWSVVVGGTATNWTTNQAGTIDPQVTPSATTDVIFSASSDANESNTVLGANMAIDSLTVSDTNAVVISGSDPIPWLGTDTFTLTVSGTGGIAVNSGAGPLTISANVALAANQTWTNNSAQTLTESGQVTGPYSLTKAGSGKLLLSGDNTYTGPTAVNSGGVIVTGSLNGSPSISVAAGANLEVDGLLNGSTAVSGTLSGTGSVGALTIANGGVLAPGLRSGVTAAGVLTANGNVSLGTGSVFSIRVGVIYNFDNDQLNIGNAGVVSLDGATLQLTLGTGFNPSDIGTKYVIINGGASGTGTDGNTFAQGSSFTDRYNGFDIIYATDPQGDGFGTGADVVLEFVSVPEPATWAMMLAGLGALALLKLRRGRRPQAWSGHRSRAASLRF